MQLSRHRLFSALAILVVAFPVALYRYTERVFNAVVEYLAPTFNDAWDDLDFGLDNRMLAFAGDAPLEPALQNSLRHEAGMRPLSG